MKQLYNLIFLSLLFLGAKASAQAVDDTVNIPENGSAPIYVTANDNIPGIETATLSIESMPANGAAFVDTNLNPDMIVYTPNPGFTGTDTLIYVVTTSDMTNYAATVHITVYETAGPNDIVANDDFVESHVNIPVAINVLDNDNPGIGLGAQPLVITVPPINGTATVNDNGTPDVMSDDTILYTPNLNFIGSDTFVYLIADTEGNTATATVNITLIVTLDYIVAHPDTATTDEDMPVVIDVLANDSFGGFGPGTTPIFTTPAFPEMTAMGGIVSVMDNNTPDNILDDFIVYSPNLDINGVDTFNYTITSANGDTSTTTVTVIINPESSTGEEPYAVDDMATTFLNTPITINVLANDQVGIFTALGSLVTGNGAHGTAVVNNNNTPQAIDDFIVYTPDTGFVGTDTFQYTVIDGNGIDGGMVTVTVLPGGGILMSAFVDLNEDNIQNSNEPYYNAGSFHYEMNNDGTVHDVVSSSGQYAISETNTSNTYDLSFTLNANQQGYYTVVTPEYEDVSATGSGMTEFKFAVTTIAYTDVSVELVALNAPRPGFIFHNMIAYHNNTAQTVSGTMLFVRDDLLSITAVSQDGIVMATNGFTYNFTDLGPYETRYIYDISMQVPVIPNVALGDLLTNGASVFVNGDAVDENDDSILTQPIVGSYDPNDITEAHGGKIVHSEFTSDDYLTYTIRFENTGTANAENIRVENTLDVQLDENTIEMVDASEEYTMDRTGSNLVWNFDDVQLPPSEEDTQIGHGYIVYRIKPKPGYAIGDIIPNTAEIYFDFNPAIVTNTFDTEFVTSLYVVDIEHNTLSLYPNPVKDKLNINSKQNIQAVSVYNLLGQQVLEKRMDAVSGALDLSGLGSGMYLVRVISAEAEKTIRILKQ